MLPRALSAMMFGLEELPSFNLLANLCFVAKNLWTSICLAHAPRSHAPEDFFLFSLGLGLKPYFVSHSTQSFDGHCCHAGDPQVDMAWYSDRSHGVCSSLWQGL